MTSFKLRAQIIIDVLVVILCLVIGLFFLLFGIGYLIDPQVSDAYLKKNTVNCLIITGIGLVPLFLALVVLRRIFRRKKNPGGEPMSDSNSEDQIQ
jgi:membrane protein implicated in regulation of membrane protease activity